MNHEHFIRYKKIGRKKNKLGAFDSLKNSNDISFDKSDQLRVRSLLFLIFRTLFI